jgi:tetratricopeptide (TPR) repeat protein
MRCPWACRFISAASLIVICVHAGVLRAQSGALDEARALRSRGEFAEAIGVLRRHLIAWPDDGAAARMLAQTLYWNREFDTARDAYESALQRHTGDQQVRVDYAEMLVEIGDARRARAILSPMLAATQMAAVPALLGTLAYHAGDFTAAARLYEQALRLDPTHERARAHLQEIRAVSTPWIRIAPVFWHDDQPLDRRGLEIEGGWFLTPLTPIRVRMTPTTYPGNATPVSQWTSEVELRHSAPQARLEVEAAAGILRRSVDAESSAEWTGRGSLGVRAPGHVTIRVRAERAPYLHTTASLETEVGVDTISGGADLHHPRGWLGSVAVERHRYPDGNVVHASFAWLLAPLIQSARLDLQAGYAISYENAAESRFVLANPGQPIEPTDPLFDYSGRYDPYYTPVDLLKHSLATSVRGRLAPHLQLRAGGSYALRASDEAPVLYADETGTIQTTFYRRESHPFEARAAIELPANDAFSFSITGELGQSPFYRWRRAGVQLTYRFHSAAVGGAR